MYEIIIQSLLCCCDFLIGLMLFHHFLLEKWNVTVGNIAVKTASVLLSGTILACINFFGIFWLNVIATVVLNFILASCFYKGKILVQLETYVPQQESHKILMSLVCFGLILCNIAVFFIYDRNLRKYELENQLREAEEMQRIQASYYKQIEKGLNESRKQLHDFKNHITTLERLYHTDSKDKALNYMHELQAQMSQQMAAASFRVNNTAFDVILYEQEKTCKEQGIIFEKQILYNDLSILKYIDTCTIFANALDNAVKACSEIQNGEKKITLEVKRTNDILSIIIENTKQNHVVCENEKFVSSKADKHNHGFGVENIKMAVEKYNGIVSIDYTDTIFTLAISIPLLNEQK